MMLTLALTPGNHIAQFAASQQDVSYTWRDSFLSPRTFPCQLPYTQPSPRARPIALSFLPTHWG